MQDTVRGQKKGGPGSLSGKVARREKSPEDKEKELQMRRDAMKRVRGVSGPDLSDKIEKVGENEFIIQKDAIEETLNNLNNIITQARVIPNFVGGGADRKVDGFRIYRIQPGSIFQYLGLVNGDVIKSINGEAMDNMEKGIQLLQSLRNETSFNLSIERQSKPLDLSYEVE